MRFVITALAILFLAAGCQAALGSRPALPTAVAGVDSSDVEYTPRPRATRTPGGPTSTPAPWATMVPATPLPGAPMMDHIPKGNEDCTRCHIMTGSMALPKDHKRRTNVECLGCHPPPDAISIPMFKHPIEGYEACMSCHLEGLNKAPLMPGKHAGRMNDTCLTCHKSSKNEQ